MKLIIGLGNPEKKYDHTRHNVGFSMIDAFAQKHQADWQDKSKMKGWLAETTLDGEKVFLLKSLSYYNLSGEAARLVKDFYKIDNADILIVHDELALPFGTVRTRLGGSDAGNNGVKSLNQHLGLDTHRVRVGIWNDKRDVMDDADFVLGKFSTDEQKKLEEIEPTILKIIENFVAGTHEHHTVKA